MCELNPSGHRQTDRQTDIPHWAVWAWVGGRGSPRRRMGRGGRGAGLPGNTWAVMREDNYSPGCETGHTGCDTSTEDST